MGRRFTPLDTSREVRENYTDRWPIGGEYVIPPAALPDLFWQQCSGLVAKTWHAIVRPQGLSGGAVDFLFSLLRVDQKARALDQDPALVRFHGDRPAGSGVLLHHPSFLDRTIPLSGEPWNTLNANRSGDYIPFSGLPATTSGLATRATSEAYHGAAARLSGC
jgi:hypothetical protein